MCRQQGTRERSFHTWVLIIIHVLDGDSVPKLLRLSQIELQVFSSGFVGVREKSKAKWFALYIERAFRNDREISDLSIQTQDISRSGSLLGLHFGSCACGKTPRSHQVNHSIGSCESWLKLYIIFLNNLSFLVSIIRWLIVCENAAILFGAQGSASDKVCDEKNGAQGSVASDGLCSLSG